MGTNPMDFSNFQEMAQRVLGADFFEDFFVQQAADPKYNLYRNSSEIIILINLPYIKDLSQVKLVVHDNELSISGKIEFGYDHMELVNNQLFSGQFEKKIPLPEAVNSKKVNAHYQKGILKVQLFPKLKKTSTSVDIQPL